MVGYFSIWRRVWLRHNTCPCECAVFPLARAAHQTRHVSVAFLPTHNISLGGAHVAYVRQVLMMRLVILIIAALLAVIPALAHSWYPLACCGNMNCFPVACDQLMETASGWLYVPTGNLFQPEQVQPSQDHDCHVCLGHTGNHRSICAFIVPNV